jgi:hypothetical protein
MPLTKVFGISSAGFNSGEDDIENYNAMVESEIRAKLKHPIMRMVQVRCQKMFGFVPDDLKIEFKPLRMLSAEQEENVKNSQFQRLIAAKTAGEIDSLEFRNAVNSNNLLPIKLDIAKEMVGLPEEETKASALSLPKSTLTTPKTPEVKNSIEYDVAAYEAEGGDMQFAPPPKRIPLLEEPGIHVDKSAYDKAVAESQSAYGKKNWGFIRYIYHKLTGKTL